MKFQDINASENFTKNFEFAVPRSWHAGQRWSHRLTQECFIKLWQTSNSLDEFMVKINKINQMLAKVKKSIYNDFGDHAVNVWASGEKYVRNTYIDAHEELRTYKKMDYSTFEYTTEEYQSMWEYYNPSLSSLSKGYVSRATRYRNKGVPMKKLEWFVPTPKRKHPVTDWEALAKIAEESA
tara:strand:- start:44 stop:586 length:543 start_codon:yes stop_codon:yes gene_type:complete